MFCRFIVVARLKKTSVRGKWGKICNNNIENGNNSVQFPSTLRTSAHTFIISLPADPLWLKENIKEIWIEIGEELFTAISHKHKYWTCEKFIDLIREERCHSISLGCMVIIKQHDPQLFTRTQSKFKQRTCSVLDEKFQWFLNTFLELWICGNGISLRQFQINIFSFL